MDNYQRFGMDFFMKYIKAISTHLLKRTSCMAAVKRTIREVNVSLCDQSFLNESAYSADESNVKVLLKYPSTTFVYAKT